MVAVIDWRSINLHFTPVNTDPHAALVKSVSSLGKVLFQSLRTTLSEGLTPALPFISLSLSSI